MKMWIRNSAHLGWLVDPEAEMLYIYRADGSQDQRDDFEMQASGENVLSGFVLDLEELLIRSRQKTLLCYLVRTCLRLTIARIRCCC